jgi:hypothetical protein
VFFSDDTADSFPPSGDATAAIRCAFARNTRIPITAWRVSASRSAANRNGAGEPFVAYQPQRFEQCIGRLATVSVKRLAPEKRAPLRDGHAPDSMLNDRSERTAHLRARRVVCGVRERHLVNAIAPPDLRSRAASATMFHFTASDCIASMASP